MQLIELEYARHPQQYFPPEYWPKQGWDANKSLQCTDVRVVSLLLWIMRRLNPLFGYCLKVIHL